MEFKEPNTGPAASIGDRNGGTDVRDSVKVMIKVETHTDTPRPENQFYSDQELKNLQLKVPIFYIRLFLQ